MATRITYIVAVYDMAMAYGGPEEGGWWYDRGALVRQVRQFANDEKAYAYSRRLNAKLDSRVIGPNQGKREYTSVLSDGEYRATVCENVCMEHFPAVRPHYE